MSIEVQIDRCPIDNLRDLIVLVVVVEKVTVQRQRAIEQRVLRAEFKCVDELWLECQRMCWLDADDANIALGYLGGVDRARRIGATCLIAMRKSRRQASDR